MNARPTAPSAERRMQLKQGIECTVDITDLLYMKTEEVRQFGEKLIATGKAQWPCVVVIFCLHFYNLSVLSFDEIKMNIKQFA